MRCPTCKKTDTFRPWTGTQTFKGITFPSEGDECSSCGEILFTYEEVGRHERAIASGLVARGIRDGGEFKYVRNIGGLKATEVAELIGVRPETVSRWERGDVALPRYAAFVLGELYDRPRVTRDKLLALAR